MKILKNVWTFREGLADHQGWDFAGVLLLIKAALIDMRKVQSSETDFVSVNRYKTCKRMSVCIHSLNRIIEDDYDTFTYKKRQNRGGWDVVKKYPIPATRKAVWRKAESQKNLDLEILGKFMAKYLTSCWS